MNRCREFARTLLEKANQDALALSHLAANSSIEDWVLGYHAQQAIEKAVKAVLTHRNIEFPHTHSLQRLIRLLEEQKVRVPGQANELTGLTVFAGALRYEDQPAGEPGPPIDRQRVVASVRHVLRWASEILDRT